MGLVITVRKNQWIRIGETFVKVLQTKRGGFWTTRLVIEAPAEMHIDRIVEPQHVEALETCFTSNPKPVTRTSSDTAEPDPDDAPRTLPGSARR